MPFGQALPRQNSYWNIGRRIVEEEQQGQERAKYGARLIANLAQKLTLEFGAGFSYRSLNEYRRFYLSFRDLEIMHTRVHNLTWSHFRIIMREATPEGRLHESNWRARLVSQLSRHQRQAIICCHQQKNDGVLIPSG